MDWYSSDWHIGHNNCIRYSGRPFKTVEEMDKTILENMLGACKKGDNMFFLGDLSFDKNNVFGILKAFKDKKVNFNWIVGNHDNKLKPEQYAQYCTSIGIYKTVKRDGQKIFLSHNPHLTWDSSHYNSFHLYGHVHNFSPEHAEVERRMDGKAFNVNCEFNNYMPYNHDDILEIMSKKPDNWDFTLLQIKKNVIISV